MWYAFMNFPAPLVSFEVVVVALRAYVFISFATQSRIFLVWSVQSIIHWDSSGCLRLIRPSNKKWKIYRDGSLKSGKVSQSTRYICMKLCTSIVRQLTLEESFIGLFRSCKCTHSLAQHIPHWYTMELFKYSAIFFVVVRARKMDFMCAQSLVAHGEN